MCVCACVRACVHVRARARVRLCAHFFSKSTFFAHAQKSELRITTTSKVKLQVYYCFKENEWTHRWKNWWRWEQLQKPTRPAKKKTPQKAKNKTKKRPGVKCISRNVKSEIKTNIKMKNQKDEKNMTSIKEISRTIPKYLPFFSLLLSHPPPLKSTVLDTGDGSGSGWVETGKWGQSTGENINICYTQHLLPI